MKHLSLILLLLFSTTCLGEWVSVEGKPYSYVDYERLKKDKGLIYFWELIDDAYVRGFSSTKIYRKADCGSFGWKVLKYYTYSENMGEGIHAQQALTGE